MSVTFLISVYVAFMYVQHYFFWITIYNYIFQPLCGFWYLPATLSTISYRIFGDLLFFRDRLLITLMKMHCFCCTIFTAFLCNSRTHMSRNALLLF